MPSGKQVLLHLLEEYSQKLQNDEDLSEVSEDLRVGLLLHGSTPPDMWFHVERMAWLTEKNLFGSTRQGLGLKGKNIFLTDIFESLTDPRCIPESVKSEYPDLCEDEFESARHVMWLLLTSVQYSSGLNEVENNGKLDKDQLEKWKVSYRKKLAEFRQDPGGTIGYDDEEMLIKYRTKLGEINKEG